MINYRSYFILQRKDGSFLILDYDKSIVTVESSLSLSKKFIDMINDSVPSITDVNDFALTTDV